MKNNKIRIVHLLWGGRIGGTEEYVTSLIRNLDSSKYEIHLCFLAQKGAIYEEAVKMNNIKVYYIGLKNGYDIIKAAKFVKYLQETRFDIIHFHVRNLLIAAILSLPFVRAKKIMTHHLSPTQTNLNRMNRIFYGLFSNTFHSITAISHDMKRHLIEDMKIKNPDQIEVVYNGIDLDKFNKSCSVPPDLYHIKEMNNYIIGFVGRMRYFKRPDLFVRVAAELLGTDKRFRFVMVGDGPELEKCRAMARDFRIHENFDFLGFRRDIPNVEKLFDVLLFTSVDEGFGIVIIEAMAIGVPVFAVNEGAVPEIITDKKNGILLDTTDPKEIAQRILTYIEDKKLMDEIRQNCIQDVQRFSIKSSVEEMEKIYRKLLQDDE